MKFPSEDYQRPITKTVHEYLGGFPFCGSAAVPATQLSWCWAWWRQKNRVLRVVALIKWAGPKI